VVITRDAETDPTPSQRLELGSAKTEEHAITLPGPSSPAPAAAPWKKVAAVGALAVVLGGAGLFMATRPPGIASPPGRPPSAEPTTASTSEAIAPASATGPSEPKPTAEASAKAVPSVPIAPEKGPSKKVEKPPVPVASAPHAASVASVASVASGAPSAASVAPPKPAPSTGGIVPISTMGLK